MAQRNSRSSNSRPWVKKVDFVFYHEREIREAVLDERNTCASAPIVRNASGVPDPTARAAVYNLSPLPMVKIDGKELRLPERWLVVIDKTYAWAKVQSETGLHYEVARRRYRGEDYRVTCRELHMDNSTRSRIMENIRIYAALQAVQMNLIYVD